MMQNGKNDTVKRGSTMDLLISKEYDVPEDKMDEVLIHNALSRSASFNRSSHFYNNQQDAWSSDSSDSEGDNPKGIGGRIRCLLSTPIYVLLYLTIPDCKIYSKRKWSGLTLMMCVAWIGALTYVISWMVSIIGMDGSESLPLEIRTLRKLRFFQGTRWPFLIQSLG